MKKLLCSVILIIVTFITMQVCVYAQCLNAVSGVIEKGIWTEADSPICIEGDILIKSLNIEPGVRVCEPNSKVPEPIVPLASMQVAV